MISALPPFLLSRCKTPQLRVGPRAAVHVGLRTALLFVFVEQCSRRAIEEPRVSVGTLAVLGTVLRHGEVHGLWWEVKSDFW